MTSLDKARRIFEVVEQMQTLRAELDDLGAFDERPEDMLELKGLLHRLRGWANRSVYTIESDLLDQAMKGRTGGCIWTTPAEVPESRLWSTSPQSTSDCAVDADRRAQILDLQCQPGPRLTRPDPARDHCHEQAVVATKHSGRIGFITGPPASFSVVAAPSLQAPCNFSIDCHLDGFGPIFLTMLAGGASPKPPYSAVSHPFPLSQSSWRRANSLEQ